MKEKILSIVITSYNDEEYISDCIMSVINCSMSDIEVICVDDSSYDNTYNIINCIKENYNQVSVYQNKFNMGPGYSRNLGLGKAKGKYVAFIDGDDVVSYNYYSDLIQDLEISNTNFVRSCNTIAFSEVRKYVFPIRNFGLLDNIININDAITPIFEPTIIDSVSCCTGIYKNEYLKDINYKFPCHIWTYEDRLPYFKLILNSHNFYLSSNNGYIVRRTNQQKHSNRNINRRILDFINVFNSIKNLIINYNNYVLSQKYEWQFAYCLNKILIDLRLNNDNIDKRILEFLYKNIKTKYYSVEKLKELGFINIIDFISKAEKTQF